LEKSSIFLKEFLDFKGEFIFSLLNGSNPAAKIFIITLILSRTLDKFSFLPPSAKIIVNKTEIRNEKKKQK
jgi:hypothetical protein